MDIGGRCSRLLRIDSKHQIARTGWECEAAFRHSNSSSGKAIELLQKVVLPSRPMLRRRKTALHRLARVRLIVDSQLVIK